MDRDTYDALLDIYDSAIVAERAYISMISCCIDDYRMRGEARNLDSALASRRDARRHEALLTERAASAAWRHRR